MNENISKIQEAIFGRLGQIDQQYEEAMSFTRMPTESREQSMNIKMSSFHQDSMRY